ncbi:unnamed protein product, partial [Rotaria magnacalcarata]
SKCEHPLNDANRRKIVPPLRRPMPTIPKPKTNSITRKLSSSPPPTKRVRSSSPSSSSSSSSTTPPFNGKAPRIEQAPSISSNLPANLTWQPSLVLPSSIGWPSPVDVNRFQYPFFVPPLPPAPPPLLP